MAATLQESLMQALFCTKDEEYAFKCGWNAATKAAEEKFTSTNKPSAKLPTFEEVDTEVISELKQFGVRNGRPLHRMAYDFICRQLSA